MILQSRDAAADPAFFEQAVHWTVLAGEAAGIAVIVLGALVATGFFLRRLLGGEKFETVYHEYRGNLGRAILLGLELLVAADIIGTVAVDPTFRNLGVLAGIVLIRTFLSFALEVEIDGHWPWQDSKYSGKTEQTESL